MVARNQFSAKIRFDSTAAVGHCPDTGAWLHVQLANDGTWKWWVRVPYENVEGADLGVGLGYAKTEKAARAAARRALARFVRERGHK